MMALVTADTAFRLALGLANAAAVTSWLRQWRGLTGEFGVTPAAKLVEGVAARVDREQAVDFTPDVTKLPEFLRLHAGVYRQKLRILPSVFTLTGASDAMLEGSLLLCYVLIAALVLVPSLASPAALGLAIIWGSHLAISKPWLQLQMDSKLVEADVLFALTYTFRTASPTLWVTAMRWLGFRIMVACAAGKYSGADFSWRDMGLPAMGWHYFTQPLPNALSRPMHFLPGWVHGVEVAATYLVEGVVPLGYFSGSPATRALAWLLTVGFNVAIGATGNYGHLHLLMGAIAMPLLADTGRCSGSSASATASAGDAASGPWYTLPLACPPPTTLWHLPLHLLLAALGWTLFLAYLAVSLVPLAATFRGVASLVNVQVPGWARLEGVYGMLSRYHLVGYYSKFSHMTKARWELQLEGTVDGGRTWHAFSYVAKPGGGLASLDARPRTLVPGYRPTFDWRQWFVPLTIMRTLRRGGSASSVPPERWYRAVEEAVLLASPAVLDLLVPPPAIEDAVRDGRLHAVRTVIYDYRFTDGEGRRALAEKRARMGWVGAGRRGSGQATGSSSLLSSLKPSLDLGGAGAAGRRGSDGEPQAPLPSAAGALSGSPLGRGASSSSPAGKARDPSSSLSSSPSKPALDTSGHGEDEEEDEDEDERSSLFQSFVGLRQRGDGVDGTPQPARQQQRSPTVQGGRSSLSPAKSATPSGPLAAALDAAEAEAYSLGPSYAPPKPLGGEAEVVPDAWFGGRPWSVGSVWSRRFVCVYDLVVRPGVSLVQQEHEVGGRLPGQPRPDFPGLEDSDEEGEE